MLSETERVRMREVEQAFTIAREQFESAVPEGAMEIIIGTMMAAIDAAFAIRDGEAWRGLTDPKAIAKKLLEEAHLGDEEEER